jgi:cobalamin biosynthesis protein CobT
MITEKKKLVERVSNEREEETDDEETGSQDDSTGDEETGSQDDSTGTDEEVSTDKTDDSSDDEGSQDTAIQDEQRMELSHEEYLSFDYTNFQDDDGIRVTLGIEDENDYPIFVEKEKIKELAAFLKQVSKKLLALL